MTSSATKDLTKGNISKLILTFATPLFISQLFQQLYNTADTFIVGNYLGTESLAAVGSSGNLIFLLISFFEGLFMGAGVLISKYFGANDEKNVSRAVHTTFSISIIIGVFLTAVGVFLTPTFLRWMNTDKAVFDEAVEYFRFYFFGGLPLVMFNMSRGVMTAVGDSRHPLRYLMFSSFLNIALDVLFVGVYKWGVWSAAFATVISETASVLLCFTHLFKKGSCISVSLKKLKIHPDILKEIVSYGLPMGVQNSVIGFANVMVQSQINTFGKYAMAAYGTEAKIQGFVFLPIISFNTAITTFISQNLGAKEYERAKKGARFGIIASVIFSEIIGVIYYFSAEFLFSIFDKNPEVIALGKMQAQTMCLFYFIMACSHAVASVLRGAGKAFVPMFVMLDVWCVLRIIYIMIVSKVFHNIRLIYWAYPITWTISTVFFLFYYKLSNWVHGLDKKEKAEK